MGRATAAVVGLLLVAGAIWLMLTAAEAFIDWRFGPPPADREAA